MLLGCAFRSSFEPVLLSSSMASPDFCRGVSDGRLKRCSGPVALLLSGMDPETTVGNVRARPSPVPRLFALEPEVSRISGKPENALRGVVAALPCAAGGDAWTGWDVLGRGKCAAKTLFRGLLELPPSDDSPPMQPWVDDRRDASNDVAGRTSKGRGRFWPSRCLRFVSASCFRRHSACSSCSLLSRLV